MTSAGTGCSSTTTACQLVHEINQCVSAAKYIAKLVSYFCLKGLERAVVRRARSDGVKAVIVVPTAYKAGYWMTLRNHAIKQLELTQPSADFANAQAPGAWTQENWLGS